MVSPGEWAFIMMPPGLTIGFILSLLLVATMLPGLEEVKVTVKRDREKTVGQEVPFLRRYNHRQRDLSLSPIPPS